MLDPTYYLDDKINAHDWPNAQNVHVDIRGTRQAGAPDELFCKVVLFRHGQLADKICRQNCELI